MWSDPFADSERLMVDYLTAQTPEFPPDLADTTVGVMLPDTWHPKESPPHIAVALDFTDHLTAWGGVDARQTDTIRVTVWADSPTTVKKLARIARSAVMAFPARRHTGMVVTRDPDNLAPMASFTVRLTLRPDAA